MIDVSERIEELLKEKRMTKYQLAKQADIPLSTLSTMISHKSLPRYDTIYKLCSGFKVTVSYFFKEKEVVEEETEEVKLARQVKYLSEDGQMLARHFLKYLIENDNK